MVNKRWWVLQIRLATKTGNFILGWTKRVYSEINEVDRCGWTTARVVQLTRSRSDELASSRLRVLPRATGSTMNGATGVLVRSDCEMNE